jgi:hypothetical protein
MQLIIEIDRIHIHWFLFSSGCSIKKPFPIGQQILFFTSVFNKLFWLAKAIHIYKENNSNFSQLDPQGLGASEKKIKKNTI